jgi:hypothetical protein
MENTPEEFAMLAMSMNELRELRRIVRGHCRSLTHREARGDEVPRHKIDMANSLLDNVNEAILEVEMYDIVGDSMIDGTFELVMENWQDPTGDHG